MPTTRSKRKAAQIADDRISATEAKPLNDKDTEGLKQTSRKRSKTSKATTSTTKKTSTKKTTTKKSTTKKSTSNSTKSTNDESQSQKSKTDPKAKSDVIKTECIAKRQKKEQEADEKAERAKSDVQSKGFDGWLEEKGVSPLSTLGVVLANILGDKAENIKQHVAHANKVYATALKRQAALWSALKSVDVAALPLLPADVSAAVEKYLTAGGESDLAAAVIGAAKAFVRAVGDCSWRARLASLLDEPRRVTDVAELLLRDHDDNDANKRENQPLSQADDCGLHTNDSAKRLMKQLEKSKTFALDANTGYVSLAIQSTSADATPARRRAEITLALKAKGVLSPFDDDVQQLVEEYAGGEAYLTQREAKQLSRPKITVAELKKLSTQLAMAGRSKLTRTELLTAVAAATTRESVRSLNELLTSYCVKAAVNRINDQLMKSGRISELHKVAEKAGMLVPPRLHLYSEAVEWFLADAPLPDASDPFVNLSLHSRLQIVQFVRTGASVPIDSDDSEYESEDDAFQSLRALARSSRVMALTIALDALRLKSRLSVALADLLFDPAQRSNWLAIEAHRAKSNDVSPKAARAVECIVAAAEKKHGIKLGRAISKASAAAREELRVRGGEWGSKLSYMDPENAKKSPVALQRTLYRFYTRVKRKALHWSVLSDSVDLADDDESSSSS